MNDAQLPMSNERKAEVDTTDSVHLVGYASADSAVDGCTVTLDSFPTAAMVSDARTAAMLPLTHRCDAGQLTNDEGAPGARATCELIGATRACVTW